jgi:hypothetical protein
MERVTKRRDRRQRPSLEARPSGRALERAPVVNRPMELKTSEGEI